ncbi:MAG: phage tail tape measure protein [Clostridiales bacterium]|nr:phage tail tape measure protein [Clostridiales bacterium]
MSNVAGIKGIAQTSDEYKKLEEAARNAGKSTTKTAQESADALSYMALAGWSVEDSISGLEPVLRASEATGADLATTSDLITDSMSAMGIGVEGLEGYLDICAAAQNNSNTSLTQLQEAFINCGATLNSFNVGAQEGATLLGVLANRGLKGSEAGNSLQSVLVNLTKKSGESYDAMQALGVSAYDANGDFKDFSNVLEEVNQATEDMTEEQRNTYLTMIGGKTQLTTLQDLMAGLNTQLANGEYEFDNLYNTLGDCEGALDRMADTMTDNLAGALSLAQSATDDFKIEIGSKLEPYITQAVRWFSEQLPEATEKFGAWLDSKIPKAIDFCKNAFNKLKPIVSFAVRNFEELVIAGAAVVAGLKAFSIAVRISTFVNKLSGVMKGLSTAQKLATVAQTAFNTSLLACPLTWIAAGIAAVAAGVLI